MTFIYFSWTGTVQIHNNGVYLVLDILGIIEEQLGH